MSESKPYYDKETTLVLKGIALVLMFIHHFWGFPEKLLDPPNLPEAFINWANIPARFCVAIFCFITGYIYYFSKDKSLRGSLIRIGKLLVPYFTVFFLLILVSVVLFHHHYSFIDLIWDVLTDKTVATAWYVRFFILLMLTAPLFSKYHPKSILSCILLTCVLLPVIICSLSRLMPDVPGSDINNLACWSPAFVIGYLMAENNILEKADSFFTKNIPNTKHRIVLFTILACIIPMENYAKVLFIPEHPYLTAIVIPITDMTVSLFLFPMCMFCLIYVCKIFSHVPAGRIVGAIGAESTIMWFIHCVFFTYKNELQPVLFLPRNPILITLWGLLLCYIVSAVLRLIIERITKLLRR